MSQLLQNIHSVSTPNLDSESSPNYSNLESSIPDLNYLNNINQDLNPSLGMGFPSTNDLTFNLNLNKNVPINSSETATSSGTTKEMASTQKSVLDNDLFTSSTSKNSPCYIFIDFESNDSSKNKVEFTSASYLLVNSENFLEIERKSISFLNDGCSSADAKTADTDSCSNNPIPSHKSSSDDLTRLFQTFVDSLSDAIHNHCILKDIPFLFIIETGWDLRVRFIKLSRNLNIQLPNYLEHPRYFDLKKEFIKFEELNQLVEFNSINYVNSSLRSIKETLEISDDSFANIDLLAKITQKIIKLNNSPYVFKRPHDMSLDLSQFFVEKSRILYLTNLPHDTTQSELESWFNQFNKRTLALWTLKTPLVINQLIQQNESTVISNNEINKTSSGFAILPTHEDVIDLLNLNGEVFNDKLIEIQPSSIRVLEKAQDILSPFPSSKNKPRPGDWTCPSCGFSNFQRRTACFRCSFPAASAAAVQESMHSNVSSTSINYNKNMNHSNNNNNNTYSHSNNNQYNSYNHNYNSLHTDSLGFNMTANNSNGSNNNNNNNNNNSGYSSRQSSSNVPFRAGDWKCLNETCAYHNFAKNVCCLKCGAVRVQSAIINGHAHNQHQHHQKTVNLGNHGNNNMNQLVDSTYTARSNSLQGQPYNQGNGYINKFKNNSDLYDLTSRSVPGTPTLTANRGLGSIGSFNNVTPQTPVGTASSLNDPTFDLTNRITGLSLNNTGTSGNSLTSNGNNGAFNNLNFNNMNIGNNMNLGINFNGLNGINGYIFNGLSGFNGYDGNNINNSSNTTNNNNSFKSPISSGSNANIFGKLNVNGMGTVGDIERTSSFNGLGGMRGNE